MFSSMLKINVSCDDLMMYLSNDVVM